MNKQIFRVVSIAAVMTAAGFPNVAFPQSEGKPKKVSVHMNQKEVRRSSFSGNEVRLGIIWAIEPNCSAAPMADVRVVRRPANGELSFREIRSLIEVKKDSRLAHCNGRPINGIGIYYQSRAEYSGTERMQIDVDYKIGLVRSYRLIVQVR